MDGNVCLLAEILHGWIIMTFCTDSLTGDPLTLPLAPLCEVSCEVSVPSLEDFILIFAFVIMAVFMRCRRYVK